MAALPDGTVVDDVWKACAYGDMAKLRQYVAEDPTLVNAPDKTGCAPARAPLRAAIDRSLASSKRAGWLNGGRTRRKASGGGIARHDVMGAGVSTHLVCCSTKCAARAGRPGEEAKLVSC